jgi:DNA-binding MarR family transcriptional regulator
MDETAPLGAAPGQPAGLVAAWREMQACHASVCATLDREMGERHGLGVSDFEVLDRLAENPAREWRAQDLADAVHLSQSALSRLVDRLAKAGLVERCACDMDRRGIYVQLTEAGARRHGEASATHRAVLERLLPMRWSAPAGNLVTNSLPSGHFCVVDLIVGIARLRERHAREQDGRNPHERFRCPTAQQARGAQGRARGDGGRRDWRVDEEPR